MACRRNTYLWRHSTTNSTTVLNRSSEVAKRYNFVADNAIFKNMAQTIACSFGCVTHRAVLLESNLANILLFNFCEQKFVQHGLITIAIDCNDLSLLIFKEMDKNLYQTETHFSIYASRFSVPQMRQVCLFI